MNSDLTNSKFKNYSPSLRQKKGVKVTEVKAKSQQQLKDPYLLPQVVGIPKRGVCISARGVVGHFMCIPWLSSIE